MCIESTTGLEIKFDIEKNMKEKAYPALPHNNYGSRTSHSNLFLYGAFCRPLISGYPGVKCCLDLGQPVKVPKLYSKKNDVVKNTSKVGGDGLEYISVIIMCRQV